MLASIDILRKCLQHYDDGDDDDDDNEEEEEKEEEDEEVEENWEDDEKEENTTSPQQGDLMLSDPPLGQGAGGGARTRDKEVPADLRADSLATVPPTPP
ncbi:hypothetical protein PoB_001676400 [Plakobranchus ocellatus]|uniref:Uncharacterized protein n=1 Tax=Plakobranchus ocellatus TaxID=259542 RepID=A0AAV3Z797_9GAST|nr:hypothetical protein PoB_001676400 [Plakobranchus ocellatus]